MDNPSGNPTAPEVIFAERTRRFVERFVRFHIAERAYTLQEILQAILDSLRAGLGADRAAVLLYDAERVMRFRAAEGLSAEYQRAVEGHSPWTPDDPDPQPVLVADVAQEMVGDRYQPIVLAEGIGAVAYIPIRHNARLLGKFMIYYNRPHVFFNEEVQLGLSIAGHLAVIISRQESERQLRQAQKDLESVVAERTTAIQALNAQLTAELAERRRSEGQLATFKAIFDAATEAIGVSDPAGRMIYINPAHQRLFGYTVAETALFNWSELYPPASAAIMNSVARKAIEQQGTWQGELDVFAKDGRRFPVWMRLGAVADHAGQVQYLFGFMHEITAERAAKERLQALVAELEDTQFDLLSRNAQLEAARTEIEAARRAAEERETRFRLLYEENPVAYQSLDENGRLIQVNPAWCALLGYSRAEALGQPFEKFLTPEDTPLFVARFPRFKETGEINGAEFNLLAQNGQRVLVSVSGRISRGAQGQFIQTHCILHDITESRRAEEELRRYRNQLEMMVQQRAERIRQLEDQRLEMEKLAAAGRLAARVAHEINNPLAGVKNGFLLLKDAIPPNYPYYEYVGWVEEEIDRIAAIVRQMYELYRPENAPASAVDLDKVVHEVVGLLDLRERPRGVAIVVESSPTAPIIRLREMVLRQVLFNLIQNAVEASPDNGVVQVQAHVKGVRAEIAVTDAGPGIPDALRSLIFEPFFTTKGGDNAVGLGLGLAITRSLVMSVGGTIELKTQVGHGATFRVTLPAEPA